MRFAWMLLAALFLLVTSLPAVAQDSKTDDNLSALYARGQDTYIVGTYATIGRYMRNAEVAKRPKNKTVLSVPCSPCVDEKYRVTDTLGGVQAAREMVDKAVAHGYRFCFIVSHWGGASREALFDERLYAAAAAGFKECHDYALKTAPYLYLSDRIVWDSEGWAEMSNPPVKKYKYPKGVSEHVAVANAFKPFGEWLQQAGIKRSYELQGSIHHALGQAFEQYTTLTRVRPFYRDWTVKEVEATAKAPGWGVGLPYAALEDGFMAKVAHVRCDLFICRPYTGIKDDYSRFPMPDWAAADGYAEWAKKEDDD